jgi:uncharacterized membrane protein
MSLVAIILVVLACGGIFLSMMFTLKYYKPKTATEFITGTCGTALYMSFLLIGGLAGVAAQLLGVDLNNL